MAANNIQFKIGSAYSGEGFQKAREAVGEMNQNMKKGISAANQLAGAFGGLDTSASKAISAMTGMLQTLLTFNATAILTQAALLAINAYIADQKEKCEELIARMNGVKDAVDKAFGNILAERIKGINTEIKNIGDEFDRITKQANELNKAIEGVRSANAEGGVVSLEVEKLNKLLETHSEEERKLIESTYNIRIAQEKLVNTEAEYEAKVKAAAEAIETNAKKQASLDEQIQKLSEERAELQEQANTARMSGNEKWKTIQDEVNKLMNQEAELERKKNEAIQKDVVLEAELEKAKIEQKNAVDKANVAVMQARLSDERLTEEKDNRATLEKAAADEAKLNAIATKKDTESKNEQKELKEEAKDLQIQANEAAKKLADAEVAYANALEQYNRNINKNLTNEAVVGHTLRQNDATAERQDKAAEVAVNQGIKDGTIRNSKQQHDVEMAARRAQRDAESSQEAKQMERDQQRADRINKMGEKSRSAADKKFLEDFNKRQEAKDLEKQNVENAKKALDDAKKADETFKEDVAAIRKKLDQLGLK